MQYVTKQRNLTEFDYSNQSYETDFLEALRNTSFEGVTVSFLLALTCHRSRSLFYYIFFFSKQGPVRFYNNERRANILLKQFQVNAEVKIGEFNSMEKRLYLNMGESLRWVRVYCNSFFVSSSFICFFSIYYYRLGALRQKIEPSE